MTFDEEVDLEGALRRLRVGRAQERIVAARLIGQQGTRRHAEALRQARRRELDHYVRRAIDSAIDLAEVRKDEPLAEKHDDVSRDEPNWGKEVHAGAIAAVSKTLVHELRRVLGLARLAVAREVDNVDKSETAALLDRLSSLLDAIETLGKVAVAGDNAPFDLGQLAIEAATRESERFGVPIDVVGPESSVALGNRSLIALVLENALSNACDSTLELPDNEREGIVVNWGVTDRDAWLAVLDRGGGPPIGLDPFAFAKTDKEGHLGVGLALARQAMSTLDGEITLEARPEGGATLRASWPQDGA